MTRAISPPPSSARSALLGYDDWRRRQAAQPKDATRRIGVGLACYAQGTGLGPFEGTTVRVDASGKVYVLIGVAAQGQGHATTLAQVCAQELGAAFEDVIVAAGDTTLFPFGMGTGGSRVMVNAGPAVANTAREVRERAALVAAELLECAPADVRIEASRAFVAGMPDRTVPLGRLAQAAVRSRSMKATGEPGLHACTYYYPDTVTWAFGTQAAAVEVDLETAAVRLLGYAVVHDPGRAINPMIVEAQLQGGAVQAIGAGLMEADRLRRGRPAPLRQPHGLRHSPRRRPAADSRWRSPSTARPSTPSASRAWARAAPSPAPPPSPTPWRTPSPTSASPSARSR